MAWQREFDEGSRALSRGDFAKAENAYRRAAKSAKDDPRRVRSLHQAARAAHARGRIESARKTLERAIRIAKKLEPDDVERAAVHRTLGLLFWNDDRPDEAARLFLEVLHGPLPLRDLARALAKEGEYARALPLFQQLVALVPEDDIVPTTREIGDLHAAMGQFGEALACYERALELESSRSPTLEEASLLGKIAHARRSQGMVSLESMLELSRRRVSVIERVLGASPSLHEALEAPLTEIASTLEAFEQWDASSIEWERLLALQEAALGKSHPKIARTLSQLSRLRERQGRRDEAAVALRRAVAIEESNVPGESMMAVLLPQLARLCAALGQISEAESLLRRAIARAEAHETSPHELALRLDELARLFESNDRHGDARTVRAQVVDLAIRTFGPNDPTVAGHIARLAIDCDALGDVEQAVPLHARALELWETLVGSDSPEATACRERLHAALNRRVVSRQGMPSQ